MPGQSTVFTKVRQPAVEGDVSVNLQCGVFMIAPDLQCGVFMIAPDPTNPPTQANMLGLVYAADDNHVSTLNTLPKAGILVGFDGSTGWPLVFISPLLNALV